MRRTADLLSPKEWTGDKIHRIVVAIWSNFGVNLLELGGENMKFHLHFTKCGVNCNFKTLNNCQLLQNEHFQ